MSAMHGHGLTCMVFLPLLGALLAWAFPPGRYSGIRSFALLVSLADLALAILTWVQFDSHNPALQFTEHLDWIPSFGIHYDVGIDGVALVLILLTTFLTPLVILSTSLEATERMRAHMICLLLLETSLLGAFAATDLFLFYVFWEGMLIPMYFLIGVWGGRRRIDAALKFFLYTMAGSLLLLVATLYTVGVVADQGGPTFSWIELTRRLAHTPLGPAEPVLFLAFAVAFAIKIPLFPFHTWLPDAHVEAPTGGSVMLAGVLLKLGAFGFLRYAMGLYPQAAVVFLPTLGILAVGGIVYAACLAMVQSDLKRLVAYSSISHLGLIMLGMVAMNVTGTGGSVLQMLNHGISTGALFLLVGMIYERRHTRALPELGGLAKVMPKYAALFIFIALSSIGLPGLNGFVGEFLILMGSFSSEALVLGTSTGRLAQKAVGTMQALTFIFSWVVLVKWVRYLRRQRLGLRFQFLAAGGVLSLAGFLIAPAWKWGRWHHPGGVWVRPFLAWTHDPHPFGAIPAVLAAVATLGVVLAAVYMLGAVQQIFWGPITHAENQNVPDLTLREGLVLAPLVVAVLGLGLYPQPFLNTLQPAVFQYAQTFRQRAHLPALPAQEVPWHPTVQATVQATVQDTLQNGTFVQRRHP